MTDGAARSPVGDMPPDEFEAAATDAVRRAAEYLRNVGDMPVLARVAPGDLTRLLPDAPPDRAESMQAILDDVDALIVPALTHWNHPRFHAYFANTGSGPGIIGELLSATYNVNGMLWRTSPAATELEQVTLDWLRQLLGLPPVFLGIIMDTASMATLVALAAARERAFPEVRDDGPSGYGGRVPRIYASEQSHSSVEKAAITLGIGRANVVKVATDSRYRMRPDALVHAINADRAAGHTPLAAVATVGTTSTTSIDPVPAVALICAAEGLWLHVDGAYGGIAAIVPDLRHVLDGVEHADSLVVNPHKWLFTPVDCSAFYVRDPSILKRAFSLVPEYLRTADEGAENYMDWGVQLGRRFRALKLWMVLRYFGRDGLVERITEHVRLAQVVTDWLDADPRFEVLAPVPFATVCFRLRADDDADAANLALMERLNATGRVFLSHTALREGIALRVSIGNLRTTEDDIAELLDLLDTNATARGSD